jgi:hypothetical protein
LPLPSLRTRRLPILFYVCSFAQFTPSQVSDVIGIDQVATQAEPNSPKTGD